MFQPPCSLLQWWEVLQGVTRVEVCVSDRSKKSYFKVDQMKARVVSSAGQVTTLLTWSDRWQPYSGAVDEGLHVSTRGGSFENAMSNPGCVYLQGLSLKLKLNLVHLFLLCLMQQSLETIKNWFKYKIWKNFFKYVLSTQDKHGNIPDDALSMALA